MKLSRQAAQRIHWVLDQCLPPALRDARWFVPRVFRWMYKDCAPIFETFKDRVWTMTPAEFADAYRQTESVLFERDTDLTPASMDRILQAIHPDESILEVGCGKGVLARNIAKRAHVTALDIILPPESQRDASITWVEGTADVLPFPDGAFQTVVCTHTLEHVPHLQRAISELRRVARERVIVVVPKQRPYRYTFDLHLHFFPYAHAVRAIMGPDRRAVCELYGGDWYYEESLAP